MFLGDLFNQGSRVAVGGLDARIQLQARDLRISNVDSIGSPLSILDPVINTGTLLNNTATFGVGNPISIAFNFMFSLLGDGKHKYIYIYIYIVSVTWSHFTHCSGFCVFVPICRQHANT